MAIRAPQQGLLGHGHATGPHLAAPPATASVSKRFAADIETGDGMRAVTRGSSADNPDQGSIRPIGPESTQK